jgi:hypothetical protein
MEDNKYKIDIDPRIWEDAAKDPEMEKALRDMISVFEAASATLPPGATQEEFEAAVKKVAKEKFPDAPEMSFGPVFEEDIPEEAWERLLTNPPQKH